MNNYQQCARCYRIIYETLKKTAKIIPEELDFGFSANLVNVLSNYIGYLALQTRSEANAKELQELYGQEEL
jgi:hypothetical protein